MAHLLGHHQCLDKFLRYRPGTDLLLLGYAWPLHNIVEASRQILFGLHSRIGLNFGILLAWAAVNTAVFPCACYYVSLRELSY